MCILSLMVANLWGNNRETDRSMLSNLREVPVQSRLRRDRCKITLLCDSLQVYAVTQCFGQLYGFCTWQTMKKTRSIPSGETQISVAWHAGMPGTETFVRVWPPPVFAHCRCPHLRFVRNQTRTLASLIRVSRLLCAHICLMIVCLYLSNALECLCPCAVLMRRTICAYDWKV